MRTAKEIQEEIKAVEKERNSLLDNYTDPEYKKLRDELYKVESKLRAKRGSRIHELYGREVALRKELSECKESKKFQCSEGLKKWCYEYFRGIAEKHEIYWATEDERFVIVHVAGGMFWSSRGQQSYGVAQYELYDIAKVRNEKWNDCPVMKIDGRLTKERMKAFQDKIKEILDGEK